MKSFRSSTRCGLPAAQLIVLFLLIAASGDDILLAAENQTHGSVRVVNEREVDLAPLEHWLKKRDGERPLKAWKKIQILELKGVSAGMERCLTKDEESFPAEIFVVNLPRSIKTYMAEIHEQEQRIVAARNRVADAEKAAADLNVTSHATGRSRSVRTRNSQARIAAANLKKEKEQLAKLENDHQTFLRKSQEQTGVLAMSTGRTFSNLSIVDCGRPKR